MDKFTKLDVKLPQIVITMAPPLFTVETRADREARKEAIYKLAESIRNDVMTNVGAYFKGNSIYLSGYIPRIELSELLEQSGVKRAEIEYIYE